MDQDYFCPRVNFSRLGFLLWVVNRSLILRVVFAVTDKTDEGQLFPVCQRANFPEVGVIILLLSRDRIVTVSSKQCTTFTRLILTIN